MTIDRKALVTRHRIETTAPERWFQLGNGEFTFNADATGLQTLAGNTMAHWAWHSFPLPEGYGPGDVPATGTFERGRPKGMHPEPQSNALYGWMFENPHRLNLGRLRLVRADGSALARENIANLDRRLDLWTGLATSRYEVDGDPVQVETCCHPDLDLVASRLSSASLRDQRLKVMLDFGYPLADRGEPFLGDWSCPDRHQTVRLTCSNRRVSVRRIIDETVYEVILEVSGGIIVGGANAHEWMVVAADESESLELSCWFGKTAKEEALPDFAKTRQVSAQYWEGFWLDGGAIDLSASKDARWFELERRIVLSQYLMAVQSAGSMPPQESGLHHNSWNGQSHLEMFWWHDAHFALWNRWEMAEKAMDYYLRIAPVAQALSTQLDFEGLKWPKMVDPEGRNAPSGMHHALLWQQPHPIFLAELEHRLRPGLATLEKWRDIVFGTADHMADYATWDADAGSFALAPSIPCCELGIDRNTVFELAYWRQALEVAQLWRERLSLPRHPRWEEVRLKLAALPVKDGVYVMSENWSDTFETRACSHPDPIGPFAFLPIIEGVDFETARLTALKVWEKWDWSSCWGWDFPWMAMAAARVGEPRIAIEALLHPAHFNQYTVDGINAGWYLPGNGGLLYAVAMMAAGWDGCSGRPTPGFPDDGSWTVRWENLNPAP